MTTPFVRTTRAIQGDNALPSMIGVIIGGLLLMVWLAWFVGASVTVYEISDPTPLTLQRDVIVVTYPAAAQPLIRQGQPATIRLLSADGQTTTDRFEAVVIYVTSLPAGQVQVELYPTPNNHFLTSFRDGATGQVDIEVDHISPATLTMRAAGFLIDSPSLLLSPQSNPS